MGMDENGMQRCNQVSYIEEDSVVDYCPNGVVLKTGGCRAMVCEHFGV